MIIFNETQVLLAYLCIWEAYQIKKYCLQKVFIEISHQANTGLLNSYIEMFFVIGPVVKLLHIFIFSLNPFLGSMII